MSWGTRAVWRLDTGCLDVTACLQVGTSSWASLCFQFNFFPREQWWHPAIASSPDLGHSHWYDPVSESLEPGLSVRVT